MVQAPMVRTLILVANCMEIMGAKFTRQLIFAHDRENIMYSYRTRIRKKTFLWGGTELIFNMLTNTPLFLTVRVDEGGEPVSIGQARRDGGNIHEVSLGKLQEGQIYTFALNDICGIFAEPDNNNST